MRSLHEFIVESVSGVTPSTNSLVYGSSLEIENSILLTLRELLASVTPFCFFV